MPNGGYIASCFLLVARTHLSTTHSSRSEPHPINLHLEFLRRTFVSLATFDVKDLKLGARISNVHITLSQTPENGESQDEVEGYITMSNIDSETGLSLPTSFELRPPALPADLNALITKGEDFNWALRRSYAFHKFRRALQNIHSYLEKPGRRPRDRPRSIVDHWVRFTPGRGPGKWTNDALGIVVDMFPQVVESYINAERGETDLQEKAPDENSAPRPKYWYPTLSMNLDVKKLLPPEGVEWLFVRVQAKVIKNGRLDLDITVLDSEGEIVALSSQCSLVMHAERNTASRGRKETKTHL